MWTTLYGKNCLKVKIITGYGPHPTGGPTSYVAQLRTQMLAKSDSRNPRVAFWEDLKARLLKWKNEGNQIIAAGDWNKCSKVDNLCKYFDEVNMIESYRHIHRPPPDTVNNKSTRAIDTFWTSRSLQIRQAGYSDYGDGVCKLHRVHWIDVTFISAFGQTIPNVISPKFKLVKYDDVTIRKRFNKSYESQIVQNKTLDRAKQLYANLIPSQALS